MKKRHTTEQFIEKAKKCHGDRYDYSMCIYTHNADMMPIICKEHGVFHQSAIVHTTGHGCPQCKKDSQVCDLLGKRFGELTVIEKTNKRMNGSVIWACSCICGNRIELTSRGLKTRKRHTCGCGKEYIRVYDGYGYVSISISNDEISKYTIYKKSINRNRTYIKEHIYVMAKYLGRPIDTSLESVHHKNGIKDDNRIENLELRTRYHGKGQNIEDLIYDALQLLARHKPEFLSERGIESTK